MTDVERDLGRRLRAARAPAVVTIGTFDGVHGGHHALIRRTVALARLNGLRAVAVTFAPRPAVAFGRDDPAHDLCSVEERVARLRAAGADAVVVLPFTRALAALPARAFVDRLICDLGMRHLCVGEDFALGARREGTVDAIRALGVPVTTVPLLAGADGRKLSSTALRAERCAA